VFNEKIGTENQALKITERKAKGYKAAYFRRLGKKKIRIIIR
jgi:hypothetical protein